MTPSRMYASALPALMVALGAVIVEPTGLTGRAPDCGCSWNTEPRTESELAASPEPLLAPPAMALASIVHVERIDMSWTYAGGQKKRPFGRIRILDDVGAPVYGATVTANMTGCFKENGLSGVTGDLDLNNNGTIESGETGWAVLTATHTGVCGTKQCYFILTVTNVSSPGNAYAPSQNVETTDFVKCNVFLP